MVVAHQGGWDEILLVAGPIALFAFLLWLANRRAEEQLEGRSEHEEDPAVAEPHHGVDGERDG